MPYQRKMGKKAPGFFNGPQNYFAKPAGSDRSLGGTEATRAYGISGKPTACVDPGSGPAMNRTLGKEKHGHGGRRGRVRVGSRPERVMHLPQV